MNLKMNLKNNSCSHIQSQSASIVPTQCIGIMGGGQLGRMLAISAKQMGYQVAILDPDINCPAKQFANHHIVTNYDDKTGLDQLAKYANVITTEFENVPATSMEYLNNQISTYPSAGALLIAQNRLNEKQFFNQHNIKTAQYCAISAIDDIHSVDIAMFPAILKTNQFGYDGKGQIKVNNQQELLKAFASLNNATSINTTCTNTVAKNVTCILEKIVDIKLEVSIVVARSQTEKIAYPVVENIHQDGILDITLAPARIEPLLSHQITNIGLNIIESLDYIGVLAIEFFITQDNQILANEMAPRPHNSGHYTVDTCMTSQFEQQLRSICNLKLGEVGFNTNAIMLNLLGNIWQSPTLAPNWQNILTKHPNLKLHLYEKQEARAGRKMGHITIWGNNLDELLHTIEQIKLELTC